MSDEMKRLIRWLLGAAVAALIFAAVTLAIANRQSGAPVIHAHRIECPPRTALHLETGMWGFSFYCVRRNNHPSR